MVRTIKHAIWKDCDGTKRFQAMFLQDHKYYYITIEQYDSEGYYQAHNSFTLMESSDFHKTCDYMESLIVRNDLKVV